MLSGAVLIRAGRVPPVLIITHESQLFPPFKARLLPSERLQAAVREAAGAAASPEADFKNTNGKKINK